jgi:hypothetical protein
MLMMLMIHLHYHYHHQHHHEVSVPLRADLAPIKAQAETFSADLLEANVLRWLVGLYALVESFPNQPLLFDQAHIMLTRLT